MLRELIERAALEDTVGGLARASGLRVAVYDAEGALITASAPASALALLGAGPPARLRLPLDTTSLPADDPPATIAFIEHAGVWFIAAPVQVRDDTAGFVAVGELRDPAEADLPPALRPHGAPDDARRVLRAWSSLPELRRSADAHPVTTVRWVARQLAAWCRDELRLHAAAEEMSLIADIGELLSGEHDLQRVLGGIVARTATVMQCAFCSLRLYNPKTDELTIAAGFNLSESYLRKGSILRRENPIDDEALRGGIVYVEDARRDPRVRFPEEAAREGIVSGLTVGMLYRGRPVGVLRVYSDRRQRFRASQRALLRAVAAQAAIAVVNAQLAEERLRTAQTERQMELAGNLHARMVRSPPPPFPAVEVGLVFEPTWHIGGDFCDFLLLPDGRFLALVADVVGHGVLASLLMSYVRGAIRALAADHSDLGRIAERLNRQLCREIEPGEFVTLLMIAVERDGRRLSYCNAGHEPPLILRDGRVDAPHEGSTVLGITPDESFREAALDARPGDFVLMLTDGAIDAMNFAGEPFGRERLERALTLYAPGPPDRVLRNIHWDIRRFVGLAEQTDDLTLVGLRLRV